MIINDNKKFLFVHIPKTAGSSISKALSGNVGMFPYQNSKNKYTIIATHTYADEFKKFVGDNYYNEYYKFAFVRNPWDRLYSLYNFMNYNPNINKGGKIFDQELSIKKGYKWFLLEHKLFTTRVYLSGYILNICAQRTPQAKWITDENDIIVDFVGHFETINEDFIEIQKHLNLDTTPLPWVNKHSNSSYMSKYDNEMIDFVYKHHAKDIKLFNYQFGD